MRASELAALGLVLCSCGGGVRVYQTDLELRERCVTRSGAETCERPVGVRRTVSMSVDDRGDEVLVTLGGKLYTGSWHGGAIEASRAQRRRDGECSWREEASLRVTVAGDQVSGTHEVAQETTGSESCGPVPFGERLLSALSGLEMVEP